MAVLKPKDKVEWRAGDRPSTTYLRTGVVKEILEDGACLVRTKVDNVSVVEQIRAARLRKVEEPKKTRAPRKKKTAGKKK